MEFSSFSGCQVISCLVSVCPYMVLNLMMVFVFQLLLSLASFLDMRWPMAPSGRKTATPASASVAESFAPWYVTLSVSQAAFPQMLFYGLNVGVEAVSGR